MIRKSGGVDVILEFGILSLLFWIVDCDDGFGLVIGVEVEDGYVDGDVVGYLLEDYVVVVVGEVVVDFDVVIDWVRVYDDGFGVELVGVGFVEVEYVCVFFKRGEMVVGLVFVLYVEKYDYFGVGECVFKVVGDFDV